MPYFAVPKLSRKFNNSICTLLIAAFLSLSVYVPQAQAADLVLPTPGTMVHLSPVFNPPILRGIKVHPDNPFRLDFILDKGNASTSLSTSQQLKDESNKLIKYFLASLTIPEKDLWVNLSPYENDRIVPEGFGQTEMGRDLLAQDYLLKQVTASLIYPEDEIGKKFWKRVYEEAGKKFGTTNVPVNTFNKVWIVPEKAVIYENAKAATAYVVESNLKVMLEEDYLSLEKHEGIQSKVSPAGNTNALGSKIVQEIVIPELIREVNQGENFARLRQVYNSLILALWYKKSIKDSILSAVYKDKSKVTGIRIDDPQEKQKIYEWYLEAFKKGAYNYIKEEMNVETKQPTPIKYFSGGIVMSTRYTSAAPAQIDSAMTNEHAPLLVEARIDQASLVGDDNLSYKMMTEEETHSFSGARRITKIAELISRIKYNLDRKTRIEQIDNPEEYPLYHIWASHLLSRLPENERPMYQESLQDIDLVWDGYDTKQPPKTLLWFIPSKKGYVRFELFNHPRMNEEDRSTVRIFYDLLIFPRKSGHNEELDLV